MVSLNHYSFTLWMTFKNTYFLNFLLYYNYKTVEFSKLIINCNTFFLINFIQCVEIRHFSVKGNISLINKCLE